MAKHPIPGPEHRLLQSFVGTWATEGTIKANPSGPGVNFRAVDTYEWVPGGFFLLHRWDAHMPDGRTQGVEIIGYDPASGTYILRSFDSSGNADVMHGRVADDRWTFEGKSLRFTGDFRDGGNVLVGVWDQRSDEGAAWAHLMDVTLSKAGDHVRDEDLNQMKPDQLIDEAKRLRQGIRAHRDSSGHELCWHHPALWALLPDKTDPIPVVPEWPEFMRGCVQYRQSLDEQLPNAPRTAETYDK